MSEPLLTIRDLTTTFNTSEGTVRAVDRLDLDIHRGEVLGLVGESGCGKSVASLSILGLVPSPPGKICSGTVLFKGRDLRKAGKREMRRIRGREIAMIFQEPMTSLNPVFTAGDQIMEVIELHERTGRREARRRTIALLERVAIPDPERRIDEYPYEMSGGMRQRVMIAMALACSPDLLIADEPTTALDVTIQAQIMDLLLKLKTDMGLAILLITHDLGVVAETADRVAVMYAGRLVESAGVEDLFRAPMHPYTQGLLRSVPGNLDITPGQAPDAPGHGTVSRLKRPKLPTIEGTVPALIDLPPGCAFAPRCPRAIAACRDASRLERMEEPAPGRRVRCILFGNG